MLCSSMQSYYKIIRDIQLNKEHRNEKIGMKVHLILIETQSKILELKFSVSRINRNLKNTSEQLKTKTSVLKYIEIKKLTKC